MQTAALARKAEKETIDKTYEFQGYPMNEDTTSLQELTCWILSKAHIQKHCVANMSRTDNYKTEKTNMIVTFRDLGTKRKINAWFLKNRGITYLNSFGHSFDSHFIRGKWSVPNIAEEMNVMLGSIWKCMEWHLGTEAMHDQQGWSVQRRKNTSNQIQDH